MSTDINNLTNLEDQVIDFDPEVDGASLVLPPAGDYDIAWRFGSKGIYGPVTDKDGNPLAEPLLDKQGHGKVIAELEGTLIAPDSPFDGQRIFRVYITSVKLKNGQSSMGDFCNKAGFPIPRDAKLSEVREHVTQLVSGEPTVRARINWEAQYKNPNTGEWENALKGMRNFPEAVDAEGNVKTDEQGHSIYNPTIESPAGNGEEVTARITVQQSPGGGPWFLVSQNAKGAGA